MTLFTLIDLPFLKLEFKYEKAMSQEDLISWVSFPSPIKPFKWMSSLISQMYSYIKLGLESFIDLLPHPFILWLPFTKLAFKIIDESGYIVDPPLPDWDFTLHGWYFYNPFIQFGIRVTLIDLPIDNTEPYYYYLNQTFVKGDSLNPVHKFTFYESLGDIALFGALIAIVSSLSKIGQPELAASVTKEVVKTVGSVTMKSFVDRIMGAGNVLGNVASVSSIAASIVGIAKNISDLTDLFNSMDSTSISELKAKVNMILSRIGIRFLLS